MINKNSGMALSVLDDQARRPALTDLARALKGTFVSWNEVDSAVGVERWLDCAHALVRAFAQHIEDFPNNLE